MKKFLNYKFLMTVLASIVVLLEVLKNVFKINLNIEAIISVSIAIVGVLISVGIITKNKDDKTIENKDDLIELINENKTEKKEDKINNKDE